MNVSINRFRATGKFGYILLMSSLNLLNEILRYIQDFGHFYIYFDIISSRFHCFAMCIAWPGVSQNIFPRENGRVPRMVHVKVNGTCENRS